MTTDVNLRELALQILMEVNEEGQYIHLVLGDVLDKYQYLDKKERAFLTRLTEGTLEKQITLDYVADCFSNTKVRKMKPLIRNVIRMSAYQILYMDAVPDHAACSEAVKLVKKHGLKGLSGFVNGVLRTIARSREKIVWPDEKTDTVKAFSVRYSVPEWMVEEWLSEYGKEQTEEILQSFSLEKLLAIRTNTLKCTPPELKQRLEKEGVCVQKIEGLPYAFAISGFDYLEGLESFREGLFYVQDVSSMRAAEAAAPKEGAYVIDVCAAPGGKSTHVAELLKGTGMVEARDLTEYKVGLIRQNCIRHGLSNMKAVQMDATVFDADSCRKADVLMCDLPCSGLGVMGRKPDIRYKMTCEKAQSLEKLQRQILSAVWDYVKPGGTLLYSTCTIRKRENEDNVAWFLEEHRDFSLEMQKQIFPGKYNDGFFLAKLIRREDGAEKGY